MKKYMEKKECCNFTYISVRNVCMQNFTKYHLVGNMSAFMYCDIHTGRTKRQQLNTDQVRNGLAEEPSLRLHARRF